MTYRDNLCRQFARLRILVGFLGESTISPWWDTNFLSDTGRRFLSITFPRTALLAGLSGVTSAARRLHDARIGKGEVHHLFRLPNSMEADLHTALLSFEPDELLSNLQTIDDALVALKQTAEETSEITEGPTLIKVNSGASDESTVRILAARYHGAFQGQRMCFPYFKVNAT